MRNSKIALLAVFKNEADILPAWLKHYENQVDYFLFRDNESTDDGYEIAKNHPKTIFIETVKGEFYTAMWGGLIEEAQSFLTENDWFVITAPDLFSFFNMKDEIKLISNKYNCVNTFFPTFFFTKEMHSQYENQTGYREQIDNFDISNYSYFRNTGRNWTSIIRNVEGVKYQRPKQEPPYIPNKSIYTKDLCFGHYRFRSPLQMKIRMELRKKVNPNRTRAKSFIHYPTWDWGKYVIPERFLYKFDKVFHAAQLKQLSLQNLLARTQK